MARSGDLERKNITDPLEPQKVQCDFSPHQQPREVSRNRYGSIFLKSYFLISETYSSKTDLTFSRMRRISSRWWVMCVSATVEKAMPGSSTSVKYFSGAGIRSPNRSSANIHSPRSGYEMESTIWS